MSRNSAITKLVGDAMLPYGSGTMGVV